MTEKNEGSPVNSDSEPTNSPGTQLNRVISWKHMNKSIKNCLIVIIYIILASNFMLHFFYQTLQRSFFPMKCKQNFSFLFESVAIIINANEMISFLTLCIIWHHHNYGNFFFFGVSFRSMNNGLNFDLKPNFLLCRLFFFKRP